MNEQLEQKFISCLDAIENGADLDEALALFPDNAAELRPYLETAFALAEMPVQPRLAAQKKSRAALLGEAAALKATPGKQRGFFTFGRILRPLAGLAALIILFAAGLFVSAESAMPGEVLYQTKLDIENIRLNLADDAQRAELEADFAAERIREIEALLADGGEATVMFSGLIESVSDSVVQVASLNVQLTNETEVVGALQVEREAAVTARASDGQLSGILIITDGMESDIDVEVTPSGDDAKPRATITPTPTDAGEETAEPTATPEETATVTATAVPTLTPTATLPPPTATAEPPQPTPVPDEDDDTNSNGADNSGSTGDNGNDNSAGDDDDDNENDNGNINGDDDDDDNENDDDDNDNDDNDNDNDDDD